MKSKGESQKGRSKREEILNRASDLLCERGPSGVNFNTLAIRLKTNRAHIRYYFRSAEEIVIACFESLFLAGQETTIAKINRATSFEAKIRAYVRGAFEWYLLDQRRMTLMLLFLFHTRLDPGMRRIHSRFRNAGLERIVELLRQDGESLSLATTRGRLIQNLITGAILSLATTDLFDKKKIQGETEAACLNVASKEAW